MIARIVWLIAIAMVAAVTTIVQLDRQARFTPGLAASVPEPFRAFAQAHMTTAALTRKDDPRAALEEAKRLIARRPIPAEHLSLLAIAQFQAGEVEQSGLTIQIAAKRGWRDLPAQEAVLRLALAAGDGAEAGRRYGALLLNLKTRDELLNELGPQVFGPRGHPNRASRDAFIDIVAGSDRWLSTLLNRGPQVMPGEAFAEIVIRSRERGAPYACKELNRAVAMLEKRDRAAGIALQDAIADQCRARGGLR
jgi:hypothetical protein